MFYCMSGCRFWSFPKVGWIHFTTGFDWLCVWMCVIIHIEWMIVTYPPCLIVLNVCDHSYRANGRNVSSMRDCVNACDHSYRVTGRYVSSMRDCVNVWNHSYRVTGRNVFISSMFDSFRVKFLLYMYLFWYVVGNACYLYLYENACM